MVDRYTCDSMIITDGYIKFHNFDNLYEIFENVVNKLDCKLNENKYLNYDKYLLATIVGCIEGNIKIDIENNSWYIWFGQYHAGYKVDNNKKFPYILLSIYKFIKNHIEYYNFITKYYDLWHNVPEYDNLEFIYDEYHILDMSDNCQQLISAIDKDIEHASEKSDSNTIVSYEILYGALLKLFSGKKMLN